MSFYAVLTLAFGLSADAFAVSLGRGASGRFREFLTAARMGLMFGASEAAMALLGYLLAHRFADYVTEADHWLALLLLGAVGGHMIYEALFGDGEEDGDDDGGAGGNAAAAAPPARRGVLGNVATVVGTSIDAAAVGVALSVIAVDIWQAVAVIGAVSFSMSTLGLLIGPRVGRYLGPWAEIMGGLVLIAIGLYIFYSHTAPW